MAVLSDRYTTQSITKMSEATVNCGYCKDCKHWGEMESANGKNCELQYGNGRDQKIWVDMYDTIFTAPDFGCILFEAK